MNSLLGRIAAGRVSRVSLLVDLLALLGTVLFVASFERGGTPGAVPWGLANGSVGLWLVGALALHHYGPWAPEREAFDDAALVTVLVLAVTSLAATAQLVVGAGAGLPSPALLLVVFWPVALLLRFGVFRAFSDREGPLDDVLVLGVGPLGRATADELRAKRRRLLGFVRLSGQVAPARLQGQVLGELAGLEALLCSIPVSEVYFASTSLAHAEELQAAIRVCERLGVPFAMPVQLFRLERARPLHLHRVPDGYVHYQLGSFRPLPMAVKRALDIVVSAAGLWLLAPLFLVVAVLVKLGSRGPVLFRQQRIGLHGKPFTMLKFRSMVQDAETRRAALAAHNEMDGPVFKIRADPRVTWIGRILRRFSIDELPQLVNVLRGDMSLVGPRPPVPAEVAQYEGWQRRRLSVRPGLTCIWQVSGRNERSFEEWMYLDLQYIDHWSLGRDLDILVRTIPVVISGRGAS